MLSMLKNEKVIKIIEILNDDIGMSYHVLKKVIDPNGHNSIFAYHIRKCGNVGIVRKDKETGLYYLTALGKQVFHYTKIMQMIFTEYIMDELAPDGKIKIKIIDRRKLKNKFHEVVL